MNARPTVTLPVETKWPKRYTNNLAPAGICQEVWVCHTGADSASTGFSGIAHLAPLCELQGPLELSSDQRQESGELRSGFSRVVRQDQSQDLSGEAVDDLER